MPRSRYIHTNIPKNVGKHVFSLQSRFGIMSKRNPERDKWFNEHPTFTVEQVGDKAVMTSSNKKHAWTTEHIIWVTFKPNGYLTIHTDDGYYCMFPNM